MIEVSVENLEDIKEKLFVEYKCNIYQTKQGFGFTNCEAEIYKSELEATEAALKYYRD